MESSSPLGAQKLPRKFLVSYSDATLGVDIPEEAYAQKTSFGYSKKAVSTIVDIFSGSVGGMCGLLVNSPFDLVKVSTCRRAD